MSKTLTETYGPLEYRIVETVKPFYQLQARSPVTGEWVSMKTDHDFRSIENYCNEHELDCPSVINV